MNDAIARHQPDVVLLSVPFPGNWSCKVSASKGWITRAGGDYKAITLTAQYRWTD